MSGDTRTPEGTPDDESVPAAPHTSPHAARPDEAAARPGSVTVLHGDNKGNISTGANTINVVCTEQGLIETDSLTELPLREAPLLAAPATLRLSGRDDLVTRVVAQLTNGTSVQLYGHAGVGKSAVADAVHHRLAADGQRGHVVRPRADSPGTLDDLYRQLVTAFFGVRFLREVDETELRAAVAEVRGTHLTVLDCPLGRDELNRLLQTFSGCTFLFTSEHLTLPDTAGAHHVQPLGQAAAIELLSAELGLELGPEGLRNLQFEHAYRLSEGRPQRLRLYAEFIKGQDAWRARTVREPHEAPPPVDPALLSPLHQAETLTVALSEPARRVLVALATFGVPLAAVWFPAVTGHQEDTYAGIELHDRCLVTYDGESYRITDDAVAAVRRLGWTGAPADAAAEGLMQALTSGGTTQLPEPGLLLAIARALNAAHQWALGSRFVRTAVPVALTAGTPQTALQLYALGRTAALRGGLDKEHRQHLHAEEQTRNVLEGDRAAVVAALALLASPVAAPAAVSGGGKTGGLLAKLGSTVTTKAGLTVAAATVAAATGAGVVVATGGGDGKPAGCVEALAANATLRDTEVRTHPDLAAVYRRSAADLDAAADKADDGKVESVLRGQSSDFSTKAEAEQGKSPEPDVHPDVVAAQLDAQRVSSGLRSLRAVSEVCPLE
ncbi:AAA family ATPase [Streptomyces cacaoi]